MRCKTVNKKAFTLAEVLITLTVIGIVASITIPSVMNDINDNQYKVAWKKSFSDMSQLVKRVQTDNPGIDISSVNLVNTFSPYLSYTRACTTGGLGESGCFHYTSSIKCRDGTTFGGIKAGRSTITIGGLFILNNGSLIASCNYSTFSSIATNCGGATSVYPTNNSRSLLLSDINGFKPPNTIGRDIFIGLLGDRFYPIGTDCDQSGAGCSAAYLYQ